jgi:DNA primase
VANLPAGADPADLASSDPEAFRAAIAEAKPFLQFRVERVLAAADLSTPEGRAKAADAALTAVAEHPDDLVRDQYVMQVAESTRMEPARLRERLERLRQEGPKPEAEKRGSRGGATVGTRPSNGAAPGDGADGEPWIRDPDDEGWDVDGEVGGGGVGPGSGGGTNGRRPAGDGSFRPGLEALRLAIHRPEEVAHRLEAALFSDGLQRMAFEVLITSDDLHQAIDTSPPPVRALLVRLTVEEPTGEPDEVVSQLVRDAVRRQLTLATREARTSAEAAAEAAAASVWVQELDDPAASTAATARLVAWLVVKDDHGVSPGDT